MKDLIEALNIFYKYIPDCNYPTNCSHDELHICMDETLVSEEDVKRLDELGFMKDEDNGGFFSFKYGSC